MKYKKITEFNFLLLITFLISVQVLTTTYTILKIVFSHTLPENIIIFILIFAWITNGLIVSSLVGRL